MRTDPSFQGTDPAPSPGVGNFLSTRLFRVGETQVTVSSLLLALAIIVASLVLSRLARTFVAERLLGRTRLTVGSRYAIGRVFGYVILALGVLVALQPLGVNATTLAVFGGALGIGLGFGLQDVVKNFVAGLIILVERPIQVGDSIEVGDVTGEVAEIRGRATVVRTNDDIYLIVPNSKFISDTVVNRSFRQRRVRYRIPVTVASGSDPNAVEAALLEAAGRSENVLADPPPTVWFREFGESGLTFELLCWTSKLLGSAGSLRSELNHLVYEALNAHGIAIPSPQLDVRIRDGI
ncbi:MAG TPA: mechanosensitive ion channel domain-containing protein [Thermoanaerobaculia bacterium]|nr:mechanosensitive ion channel domain-containing protein [Thermoanaerobaculia bacterium]